MAALSDAGSPELWIADDLDDGRIGAIGKGLERRKFTGGDDVCEGQRHAAREASDCAAHIEVHEAVLIINF